LARDAIAKGRGVVLAASHTGNFELAARHAATLVPLLAITKRQSVRIADRIVETLRGRHGVRTHRGPGVLRAARAQLASGGAVAMVIDQVPERSANAERLPFLGTPAWVDRAPFVLAARARCPIVVTAAHRDEEGIQRVEVLDVIETRRIDEAMRRATHALESFVREHPTEWLWMHRRWKTLDQPL
jgi:KDO2-lipid IV(A) lauroyltransferase